MKFLKAILVLGLVICLIGWMFETDFIFMSILMTILLGLGLYLIIPLLILILIVWVIKELFN
jgi:hypothetical protein